MLGKAHRILAFTGAGLSTASGIPDFRGPNGVWTRRQPVYFDEFLASEVKRVEYWEYKAEGATSFLTARPNGAHTALVELERLGRLQAIVTQNIDGLHHAAGSSPDRIVELHGNVREAKCIRCGWRGPMGETLDRVRAGEADPSCTECGGILKSATISFGEPLVAADLERAQLAAGRSDLFLAAGTSLGVYPAAALPEIALMNGARLVVMNAEPTPFDGVAAAVVREPLGEALPAVVDRVGRLGNTRPGR